MDERTWERIGAFAGVAFVVLMLLATFLYPQQPRIDSSPAKTLAWIHGHRTGIQTGAIFGVFAAGLFVWFAAHLRHVLVRAEGGAERLAPLVFGSGVAVAVVGVLGALPTALLAFMDAQPGGLQDANIVRMLGDLNQVIFGIGASMTVVFLLAVGSAMVRKELVAPWLGWVSLLAAVLNGVAVVTATTFSTYHGAAWAVPTWGAYLGFLVVVLVASVALLRQPAPTATPSSGRLLAAS